MENIEFTAQIGDQLLHVKICQPYASIVTVLHLVIDGELAGIISTDIHGIWSYVSKSTRVLYAEDTEVLIDLVKKYCQVF